MNVNMGTEHSSWKLVCIYQTMQLYLKCPWDKTVLCMKAILINAALTFNAKTKNAVSSVSTLPHIFVGPSSRLICYLTSQRPAITDHCLKHLVTFNNAVCSTTKQVFDKASGSVSARNLKKKRWCESRPRHTLFRGISCFFSVPLLKLWGSTSNCATTASFHLHCDAQFDNYPTIRSCTVWATVLTASPIKMYKRKQTTISHPSPEHSLTLNHCSEFVTTILPLNIVQTRWPIRIPYNMTHLSALPNTLNAFVPTDFIIVTHIYRSYACI
jgi:hypothetical protein